MGRRGNEGGVVLRAIYLTVTLMAVWLLLSGHYEPLLIWFGVVSCIGVVLVALRLQIVDAEGHPFNWLIRAPIYWIWLFWEIVKANIDVAKRIINPSLPISPTIFTVTPSQKTDLGRVTYANSITLTPGTVTLEVFKDRLEVHALSAEAAEDLKGGAMDRKVSWVEGMKVADGADGGAP